MKRFKVILTIRYQDAVRTRKGVIPAEDYQQVAGKLAKLATWQAEADADPNGPPVTVNLYLRELKPKTSSTKGRKKS